MKALVLQKRSYGESDLIVHFFLENGRLATGFASGARKSKKRFPHQFHVAGIYDLHAQKDMESGALVRIQKCELVKFFPLLVEDIERWTRWSMVLEWIAADEAAGFVFDEVVELMKAMNEESQPFVFYKFFVLQMQAHGLLPRLDCCIQCGERLNREAVFAVAEGGVAHPQCLRGLPISSRTLQIIQNFLDPSLSLEMESSNRMELDSIMVPFLAHHLGRSLKSYRLFDQLRSEIHPAL